MPLAFNPHLRSCAPGARAGAAVVGLGGEPGLAGTPRAVAAALPD